MRILGIETSCDETGAAVVLDGRMVLSHALASSVAIHQKYGGVVPEQAAREQLKAIIPVTHETLITANLLSRPPAIDAIAVTIGPGLIGSLLVGIETAKTLAWIWDKPLIPVNHLLAHFYAAWLAPTPPQFPAVGLLVSGGHTDLILIENHGVWKYLGGTRDDAAGEAFDKIARLLGLPYPGGPALEQLAKLGDPKRVELPSPMYKSETLDFSFSGLKTAVIRLLAKERQPLDHGRKTAIAAAVQNAIVRVLVEKTLRAVLEYRPISLVVAGGVAANTFLKEQLRERTKQVPFKIHLFVPPPQLCTDNAVMIATCAYYLNTPLPFDTVHAIPNLSLRNG